MITITEAAKNHIINCGVNNLKVAIIGSGCCGLMYKIDPITDEEIQSTDKVIDFDKFVVVIDSKSALFMKDFELDYQGGLNGQGFIFNSSIMKRKCGCNKSFSA